MPNYLKLSCIVLALITSATQAQSLPKELISMFPKNGVKGREFVSLDSLTVEQKTIQLHATTIHPEGYLLVNVSPEYVAMLSELNIASDFKLERDDSKQSINGLVSLGMKDEGEYKKSFAFGNRFGAQIFMTVWRYAADGSSMVVIKEFLNQNISGLTGTLTLAVAPDTDKCIWKIFVADSEISFDIMIVDVMQNKYPTMTSQRVTELAKKLIAYAKTRI